VILLLLQHLQLILASTRCIRCNGFLRGTLTVKYRQNRTVGHVYRTRRRRRIAGTLDDVDSPRAVHHHEVGEVRLELSVVKTRRKATNLKRAATASW
jgi:hypothetical protein